MMSIYHQNNTSAGNDSPSSASVSRSWAEGLDHGSSKARRLEKSRIGSIKKPPEEGLHPTALLAKRRVTRTSLRVGRAEHRTSLVASVASSMDHSLKTSRHYFEGNPAHPAFSFCKRTDRTELIDLVSQGNLDAWVDRSHLATLPDSTCSPPLAKLAERLRIHSRTTIRMTSLAAPPPDFKTVHPGHRSSDLLLCAEPSSQASSPHLQASLRSQP